MHHDSGNARQVTENRETRKHAGSPRLRFDSCRQRAKCGAPSEKLTFRAHSTNTYHDRLYGRQVTEIRQQKSRPKTVQRDRFKPEEAAGDRGQERRRQEALEARERGHPRAREPIGGRAEFDSSGTRMVRPGRDPGSRSCDRRRRSKPRSRDRLGENVRKCAFLGVPLAMCVRPFSHTELRSSFGFRGLGIWLCGACM
jgi:hypothetical protein